MAFLKAFGSYLPPAVVTNVKLAARLGCDADWILSASGIRERRAAEEQSVADLAVLAAEDCLARAQAQASEIGMLIVASGSSPRRFPGPAVTVAQRLNLGQTPALDVPIPSAGSLFGIALAANLAPSYRNILVIAAEKMTPVVWREPLDRSVAILFGDGAGACLVSRDEGRAKIVDSLLLSDGTFSEELRLEFEGPLLMNGRAVILQASRKIPRVIGELLQRNSRSPSDVDVFLIHQANQNLIDRVAQALNVPSDKFFSNIDRFGNTSSASMLIAAAEWEVKVGFRPGVPVVLAGFGAGLHWGAVLAEGA